MSYLIGLVAFWTDEVSGLYATIDRLKKFLSGGYFPLNLLPLTYIKISYALPFSYSFFVPTQLYLGKINIATAINGIYVQGAWIILLALIIALVWRRGIRRYEGVGI
jgi:ABC-2 type transport system permease protein